MLLSLAIAACVAVTQAIPGYPVARETWGTCSGEHVRVSPPAGAVVVDNSANPHPGSHATVQAGVNALSTTTTHPQQLFILPGTYKEQVYIPRLNSNLTVQGYTCNAQSYQDNKVTITYDLALINTTSDDLTATLRQWNPNTKIYNLNIVNTFGHIPQNGQNLAVSAEADGQAYYGCQLIGYQDTLLAETGRQLYAKSLIVGAVDFIFGQTALAWLEGIDIRTIAKGGITASGRDSASNPSWYVISQSTVAGINDSIPAGINYLGRPWRDYARVVFQETYLGNNIAPAGWSEWSTSTPNTDHVFFAEYANYGPGSASQEGPRASFSQQLTAPISIRSILGESFQDEWWVDAEYLDSSDFEDRPKLTWTHTSPTPTPTTESTPACTCTAYSQIPSAVASCTNIVLSNIAAPNGSAIDLSALLPGTTVTFDGTTTFGSTNSSSFNPITISGANVTITATPGAIIDGNGQAYWDGQGSNGGVPKPDHFVTVKHVTGTSAIRGLTIRNWPTHLFYINECSDLVFEDLLLDNTAGDAPNARSGGLPAAHNTDGFDVSSCTNLVIRRSTVYNQDDCVAITSGNNMTISELQCHNGHGLSIGSVGGKSDNNVTNILFTNSSVINSQNGCRIKTNYNTTGYVANITYSNIRIQDASVYGIDVQQDYLNGGPTGTPSNGVLIENVSFLNVVGTATSSASDYYILCGDGSCEDFVFENVRIAGGGVASSCNYPASGCPQL